MEKIPYIANINGYTFYVKGTPRVVTAEDPMYTKIVSALFTNDIDELIKLLNCSINDLIANNLKETLTNSFEQHTTNDCDCDYDCDCNCKCEDEDTDECNCEDLHSYDKDSCQHYYEKKKSNKCMFSHEIVEEMKEKYLKKTKPVETNFDILDLSISVLDNGENVKISYKGIELPKNVAMMLYDSYKTGVTNFAPYFEFLNRLILIRSDQIRNDLFRFLSYKSLPITTDGKFIAYKGISENYYSVHGNTETRVIKGVVDETGHIQNKPGDTIQVVTKDVDPDSHNSCSNGLHVGSYDYAKQWAPLVVAVEVDPLDVVAVPHDHKGQKCRVSKYHVLEEVYEPVNVQKYQIVELRADMKSFDTIKGDEKIADKRTFKTENDFTAIETLLSPDRILKTREAIERNIKNKGGSTTLKQLAASVGRPVNARISEMQAICITLGYSVNIDTKSFGKSTVTL